MIRKSIPNLITSLNLFCGFLAIIYTFEEKMSHAVLSIIVAMILDTMDGRAARILKVEGDFGKEYDSLADIVTFGVAPALLLYHISLHQFGTLGIIITAIFPVCGALRLARFNIATHKVKNHFIGLPITASGVILALFSLNVEFFSVPFLITLLLVLSMLMVSNLRFPNFKHIRLPKHVYRVVPIMFLLTLGLSKLMPHHLPILLIVPLAVFSIFIILKIKRKYDRKREEYEEAEES